MVWQVGADRPPTYTPAVQRAVPVLHALRDRQPAQHAPRRRLDAVQPVERRRVKVARGVQVRGLARERERLQEQSSGVHGAHGALGRCCLTGRGPATHSTCWATDTAQECARQVVLESSLDEAKRCKVAVCCIVEITKVPGTW